MCGTGAGGRLQGELEAEIIATYEARTGDAKLLKPDGAYVPCSAEGRRAPTGPQHISLLYWCWPRD